MSADSQTLAGPNVASPLARKQSGPPISYGAAFGPPGLQSLRAAFADAFAQRRMIVLLAFGFLAGIALYIGLPAEPALPALALAGGTIGLIAWLSRRSIGRFHLSLLALFVIGGMIVLPVHAALWGTRMLDKPVFGTFSFRVEQVLNREEGRQRLVIALLPGDDATRLTGIRRMRVSAPDTVALAPGDLADARIRFMPVPGPAVSGGYDAQIQAFFDGIGAYGSVTSDLELRAKASGTSMSRVIDMVRTGIGTRIDAALPQDAAAITRALLIGDQSRIAPEIRATFATAGVAHILAISGLHLSLVAFGLFALVRMGLAASYTLSQSIPAKTYAALAGMGAALAYLAISGASVSATRATLMVLLLLGAIVAGRQALTMRNVALAALVIMLIDPASVLRPSFQLSFAAVTALIAVYERRRPKAEAGQRPAWPLGLVRDLVITSTVAGAATAVFAAYHFQQAAPLGVIGNLLILPVISFLVLPLAAIGILAMPFGLEPIVMAPIAPLLDWCISAARLIAGWSAPLDHVPILTPMALVLTAAALCWFAFLQGRWRLAAPIALVPMIALFGLAPLPDILIADSTKAIAYRTANGLAMLDGKADSFVVRVWRETFRLGEAANSSTRGCDASGCVATAGGQTVAVSKTIDAFEDDCRLARLVIARIRPPDWCAQQTQLISPDDLKTGGVLAAYWEKGQGRFRIVAAKSPTNRPWRP